MKIKNEKKIQREFFERQRKAKKTSAFRQRNEKTYDGTEKISQDLLFLYPIGDTISSGKENLLL